MKAKHTPGPWNFDGEDDIRAGKTLICHIMVGGSLPDAHLIAAAPDLLAACDLCVRFANKDVSGNQLLKTDEHGHLRDVKLADVAGKAAAAIAKAEGE